MFKTQQRQFQLLLSSTNAQCTCMYLHSQETLCRCSRWVVVWVRSWSQCPSTQCPVDSWVAGHIWGSVMSRRLVGESVDLSQSGTDPALQPDTPPTISSRCNNRACYYSTTQRLLHQWSDNGQCPNTAAVILAEAVTQYRGRMELNNSVILGHTAVDHYTPLLSPTQINGRDGNRLVPSSSAQYHLWKHPHSTVYMPCYTLHGVGWIRLQLYQRDPLIHADSQSSPPPSPPTDSIWAMMTVWIITGSIIYKLSELFSVVLCTTNVHNPTP